MSLTLPWFKPAILELGNIKDRIMFIPALMAIGSQPSHTFIASLLLTFFLFIADPAVAADQSSELSACPGAVQRLDFYVAPVDPKTRIDLFADDIEDRMEYLEPLATGTEKDSGRGPAAVGLSAPLPESYADISTITGGLLKWIDNRARAEARLWLLESITDRLCDKNSSLNTFFTSTCRVKEVDVLSTSYSQRQIVDTLRQDIRELPACAIYQRWHSGLGYQLRSIYTQHHQGENLEHLLYGMATSQKLNAELNPGAVNGAKICSEIEASLSRGCAVIVPLLAYAAMLDTLPYWEAMKNDPSNPKAERQVMVAFITAFAHYLDKEKLSSLAGAYRTLNATRIDTELQAFSQRYQRFYRLRARLSETLAEVDALANTAEKEQLLQTRLAQVPQLLLAQLDVAAKQDLNQLGGDWQGRLAQTQPYLEAFIQSHSDIANGDYSGGLLAMQPVMQCLSANDPPDTCPEFLVPQSGLRKVYASLNGAVNTAALLADADSADAFAATLDSLASPVGAYRLRHKAPMWSLNAYLGAEYGEYTLDVPEHGEVSYRSGEVFAPIGISWTNNSCWILPGACGIYGQVLNLGVLAGDFEGQERYAGGVIESETDSSLQAAVSPGIYGTWSPLPKAPLTFGLGTSWGPVNYKTAITLDGRELEVERERYVGFFMALDLVMFRFGG